MIHEQSSSPLKRVLIVDGVHTLGPAIAKALTKEMTSLAGDYDGGSCWSVYRIVVPPKFRKQPKQRAKAKCKRGRLYEIWA